MGSTVRDTYELIPSTTRSAWRNTYIYASNDPDTVLGGLYVTVNMSNKNLYRIVEILCSLVDRTFHLEDEGKEKVARDESGAKPGKYYIAAQGPITTTKEVPLFRQPSKQTGTRCVAFTNAVRDRDRRCVITGKSAVIDGVSWWTGLEAAHIFPLKHYGHWKACNFSDWITVPPATESHGTINSVQNGMLLGREMHALFDAYQFSIDPDDNHKIICFTPNAFSYGIAGHLDQLFLNHPNRPVDQLLSWHFSQAVLVNVKEEAG